MRTALVGLVLVSLGVASAQAQECPETKAVLVSAPAQYQGPQVPAHPELVGKEFRVVGVRGRSGEWTRSMVLRSDRKTFVLGQIITPRTTPAMFFASWASSDRKAPRGRAAKPANTDGEQYAFWIQKGPLAGLELNVSRCEK